MAELKRAVGLTRFHAVDAPAAPKSCCSADKKACAGVFKQYREKDGRFYFKLTDGEGKLLLQSCAFDEGREAGRTVAQLKAEGLTPATSAAIELAECVTAEYVNKVLEVMRRIQAEKDAAKKKA